MSSNESTICALASSMGKGGIGVVRVSGPLSQAIAQKMLGFVPKPRYAHYGSFFDRNHVEIDQGIACFFRGQILSLVKMCLSFKAMADSVSCVL